MKLDSTIRRIAYATLTMNGYVGENNSPTVRTQRAAAHLNVSVKVFQNALAGRAVSDKNKSLILTGFMDKGRRESFPYYVHFINHRKDSYKSLDSLLNKTLYPDKQPKVKLKKKYQKKGKTKTKVIGERPYKPSAIRKEEMAKYFARMKATPKDGSKPSTRQLQMALSRLQDERTPKQFRKSRKKSEEIREAAYYDELNVEDYTDDQILDALTDFFDDDDRYNRPNL